MTRPAGNASPKVLAGAGWSITAASAWLALALTHPATTYHVAPLVTALAWPVARALTPDSSGRRRADVLPVAGGALLGGTILVGLALAHALGGPALIGSTPADESLVMIAAGAVAGSVLLRPGARPRRADDAEADLDVSTCVSALTDRQGSTAAASVTADATSDHPRSATGHDRYAGKETLMNRTTTSGSIRPSSPGRAVLVGAAAGVIASLVMAMYAMVAAYAKDTGFFTPLYHIGSLVTGDANLMTSMTAAKMRGDEFTFLLGPAVLGAMIHMMTGAMYGAVFGVIASRLRLGLAGLAGAGTAYGFLVFVISAFLGLPLAATIFHSGDPIRNMAEMAGWGTFVIEHLMYGVALGALVAVRLTRSSAAVPARAVVAQH